MERSDTGKLSGFSYDALQLLDASEMRICTGDGVKTLHTPDILTEGFFCLSALLPRVCCRAHQAVIALYLSAGHSKLFFSV